MSKMNEPKPPKDYALPELECKRCGYKWIPRTGNPKQCPNPRCRSTDWDKEKDTNGK